MSDEEKRLIKNFYGKISNNIGLIEQKEEIINYNDVKKKKTKRKNKK